MDVSSPSLPSPWLRRVLVANLVVQVGIVLTGGLVRLTGSGLGCPTWPQCVPGSYTPVVHQAQGCHKDIEFGNRMLTWVSGRRSRWPWWSSCGSTGSAPVTAPRALLWLGWAPLLGVVAQIPSGGSRCSPRLRPATVAAHFLFSMVLVAAAKALLVQIRVVEPGAAPTCSGRSALLVRPRRHGRRSCCSAPSSRGRDRTPATPRTPPGSVSTPAP